MANHEIYTIAKISVVSAAKHLDAAGIYAPDRCVNQLTESNIKNLEW